MRCAEIIAIGSELLLGGRLDTNSLVLTERLAALGIEVRFKSAVGDDERDIASALRSACARADVVLLTGGLGPTIDDRTREAVARMTRRPLRRRAEAEEAIRKRLAEWGRVPSVTQLRQAMIPAGAEVLHNPIGSAPGFLLWWKGCVVAAVPGVPSEAEQMFAVAVAPRLAAQPAADESRIRIERRVLHTFGLIEAEVDRRLRGVTPAECAVRLGLLASPLGVEVSLTAWGEESVGGPRLVDRMLQTVRRRLGEYVYAEEADTMEQVVGRHLAQHGVKLAVAESCTGGLIGHRITQVPGSSDYFDRGVICYSNEAKQDLLGVPTRLLRRYGAVSAEVARAMAKGVRVRTGADIGLSVTGIAGPGGASDRKPVGLVYVGLDAGGRLRRQPGHQAASLVREFRLHGDREAIKWRASQGALNVLRQWLVQRTGSVRA
jgi:nicotinamide-nucleotide amidase